MATTLKRGSQDQVASAAQSRTTCLGWIPRNLVTAQPFRRSGQRSQETKALARTFCRRVTIPTSSWRYVVNRAHLAIFYVEHQTDDLGHPKNAPFMPDARGRQSFYCRHRRIPRAQPSYTFSRVAQPLWEFIYIARPFQQLPSSSQLIRPAVLVTLIPRPHDSDTPEPLSAPPLNPDERASNSNTESPGMYHYCLRR